MMLFYIAGHQKPFALNSAASCLMSEVEMPVFIVFSG